MKISFMVNKKIFSSNLGRLRGWFRVFGVGISWKNINIHPLLFSERNGYTKGLQLGAYRFSILK